MSKLHVGILRGGPSSEYEVSLKTGAAVLKHLPDHYQAHDIFISKDGVWHRDGLEKSPERALKHVDVVFNALHGEFGEDGQVQKILDRHGIPYTGSGALSSAIGMNKVLSKKAFEHYGVRTPYYAAIRKSDDRAEKTEYIFKHFMVPFVVKPASSGSSVGVTIVKNFGQFPAALDKAFEVGDTALVEEFIRGREATCGVVNHFRNQKTYPLLPVEIIPADTQEFFDYDAKYNGQSQEICPGNFSEEEKAEIQRLARLVHEALNLRHYSRTDMMVTPGRGVYVLEVNTLPGLTPQSLVPQSLEAIGCSFKDFLDHLVRLALDRK
ncbi:D-alanine--D-alanine ligase [Candidatus Parcubacteria bacterium]|nr:D-alanine--D-alanine ligase [Candidatus Parcubacteria bacterium]